MRRIVIASFILALGLNMAIFKAVAQNPYETPLKARGFTALAVALPPKTVGKTVLREKVEKPWLLKESCAEKESNR